ncbi:hypothetical protein [Caballeronia cordobensis]|uniref:hypothetical protein n=1 Tax=Caballeronia cordobensis TaxID=1353886 RepID=UPI001E471F8B
MTVFLFVWAFLLRDYFAFDLLPFLRPCVSATERTAIWSILSAFLIAVAIYLIGSTTSPESRVRKFSRCIARRSLTIVLALLRHAAHARLADCTRCGLHQPSLLFSNINMQKRIPTDPAAPFRKQDLTATQKARAEALRQAESDRAEKRLENDARIDVNAAKWRFLSSTD